MPLTAGTRLGSFEVVAPLGAGGMGEVYRAHDTKLGRAVAVKLLPEAWALDQDRIARFEREAKLLAALNHPHIAALYGFEQSSGRQFLVMELVEGETLADRLARGPMPVEEALKVAHQIAEALESAHEKGIVHRDLKPANIKITPEDRVKVLDFGLARLHEKDGAATRSNLTNSPTLSMLATEAGVILGTAAYMSPEQAKAAQADHRSDVFSFGAVLYEMLTGRQAFRAETPGEIMAAVLVREPDFQRLPANLNPRIAELLRRCLEKQPRRRWQAAGDLRAEIEAVMAAPRALPSSSRPVVPPKPLWRRAIPFAVTGVVSAAIAAGSIWWAVRSPPPAVVRFRIAPGEGRGITDNAFGALAVSPDGTQLVYVANGRLNLRAMSEVEARPIAGTEQSNAVAPTFSPDGRSVAFVSSDRTLKRIAVSGGAAVDLCQIDTPFSLDWGHDGIVFSQPMGIMRVPPSGGRPETLVSLAPDERAYGPQMLPDGKTLLYALMKGAAQNVWDRADIVAHSLTTGARRTLVQGGSHGRHLPTGHLVYALGGVLLAVPFDPVRLEVTGVPVPVVEGVMRSASGGAQFATSNTGSLVYVTGPASIASSRQSSNLALLDEKGALEVLKLPASAYEAPRISPDGKRVAFGLDDGREANIWVYALDGTGSPRRLTFGGNNRFPIWSADGSRVAFQSDREGDLAIFWQPADVSGGAKRLTKADAGTAHVPESWSRTDDVLLFSAIKGGKVSLWTLTVRDRKTSQFSDVQASSLLNAEFSPDGRWIAYTHRGGTALAMIYVEPFPPTGARYQISRADELGHHPVWSPDGRTLFYVPGNQPVVGIDIATKPAFTFGTPKPWPGKLPNSTPFGVPRNYDVLPDGRRFIFPTLQSDDRSTGAAAAPQIQVVVNWFEELKARVPSAH
jgi:serine/threonine-protein kinase